MSVLLDPGAIHLIVASRGCIVLYRVNGMLHVSLFIDIRAGGVDAFMH